MNIISLFDGMSCARIALQRAGIPVEQYFASEIDKYAIQVSKANWADIIHIGDVTKVHYFEGVLYTEFGKYEVSFAKGLICGGSPCQGFSFAGKQLNFEDPRSKLFFEFVRIYKEIKSEHRDVKVFLENVVMKKEYQAVISKALGIEPVLINSALVSAQNRKRLYWTNIPFQGQPTDRGILLKHILETHTEAVCVTERRTEEAKAIRRESMKNGKDFSPRRAKKLVERTDDKANCLTATQTVEHLLKIDQIGVILNRGEYQERNEKAMCLDANYYKGADNHGQRTMIKSCIEVGNIYPRNGMIGRIYSDEGKSPSLRTTSGGNSMPKIELKDYSERCQKQILKNSKTENQKAVAICGNANATGSGVNILEKDFAYRKLTPIECERLQCVPDNYTKHVSDSQRYRMLGNGWNVDTIVHLFEPLLWEDIL